MMGYHAPAEAVPYLRGSLDSFKSIHNYHIISVLKK